MASASTTKSSPPARAYMALADLLSLETHDVSDAIATLAALPCYVPLMRRRDDEATRAALYWLMNGQKPPLKPELERLVDPGACARGEARVAACAAYYLDDIDQVRASLRGMYAEHGFNPEECRGPRVECVSYISQQLAFIAHCTEKAENGQLSAEDQDLLEHSLYEWAPDFASALLRSSDHPAVVFAGTKLASLLTYPR